MKKLLVLLVVLVVAIGNVNVVNAKESQKVFGTEEKKEKAKSGVYSVETRLSGLALEPGELPNEPGIVVLFSQRDPDIDAQNWYVSEVESGQYSLVSLSNGKCLTVEFDKDLKEGHVTMDEYAGKTNQKWVLKKNGDYYIIQSAVKSKFVLQYGNPRGLVITETNGSIYQDFKIENLSTGMNESDIQASAGKVVVDKHADKGKIKIHVSDVKANTKISLISAEVYPKGNKKKKRNYFILKDEDGNYEKTITASDFEYASGSYIITLSFLVDGNIYHEIGKYKCSVDDVFDEIKKSLESLIDSKSANGEDWQVSYKDITHNKTIEVNSHSALSASMIKLFVMAAACDNYEAICEIYPQERLDDDLLSLISVNSDTALGNLLMLLGDNDVATGATKVMEWSQKNGYNDVQVGTIYGEDFCSAKDATNLLVNLYNGKHARSEQMIDILKQCGATQLIPEILPDGVITANKTGELGQTINDAAIVYTQNGVYVLTIMSSNDLNALQTQTDFQKISKDFYEILNQPISESKKEETTETTQITQTVPGQ